MGYIPSTDRASVLYAHPDYFIQAATLLERLLRSLSAQPQDQGVVMIGFVPADIADDLAPWGEEFTDLEIDSDLEDSNDREEVAYG